MTRKEEIKKGAFDAFPNEGWERQRVSFVQGALWADEHPRKGLLDIEKVCEWLENNMHDYFDGDNEFAVCDCFLTKENFIEQLKKEMEK